MSFLFGSDAPSPVAPPVAPAYDAAAEKARRDAADAAVNASRQAGRASTIVGGMKIAEDDQYAKGSAAKQRREAARVLGG